MILVLETVKGQDKQGFTEYDITKRTSSAVRVIDMGSKGQLYAWCY